MASELRLFLEQEIEAVAESAACMKKKVLEFWSHPQEPLLAIWADPPALDDIPEPTDGSVSEKELYYQLMSSVKPALASREYGFLSAPILYPHAKHYSGAPFGTRFLAAVMGSEVSFPRDSQPAAWDASVKPLINDESEIRKLEEIDVSKSPVLQAILTGLREVSDIVQGRLPFTRYTPTGPFDFAADIIGHLKFYELVAERPEAASALVDICLNKWLEIMALQEQAAGAEMVNHHLVPGIRLYDMILSFLSPDNIKTVVLPYNQKMAEHYGSCVADIVHKDSALLGEYLRLPNISGLSVPVDWPMEPVVAGLREKCVFKPNYTWHVHEGENPKAPICVPWKDCCRQISAAAGELRVLAIATGWGETPRERMDDLLRDTQDLRRAWDSAAV